ncbi:hypothetical protein BH09PAT2_BH09PAT2_05980 [soil metagenome]
MSTRARIFQFVFLFMLLLSLVKPAVAAPFGGSVPGGSIPTIQEGMRDLTVAPVPLGNQGVLVASTAQHASTDPNQKCLWASGGTNPLDEQASAPSNGKWSFALDHEGMLDPFSGTTDYWTSNPGGGTNPQQARVDAYGTVGDVDNLSSVYVYGAYRIIQSSPLPTAPDKLYFRVKKGSTIVVDFTQIATSASADGNWQTWSFVLPGDATAYRNQQVTLEMWAEVGYYNHPSTQFIVDYSGVAYCTSLPDINTSFPVVVDPAAINVLYNGLLIRKDSTLWTHTGSGGIVYSGEFKSLDQVYKDDEFYKAVFRLKPPFDKKSYLSSANDLWFAQKPEQSEHLIQSLLNDRMPSSEKLEEMITRWRILAERQEAAGNAVRQAQVSRWMQTQMEARRSYLNSLGELERRVTLTPVTYVVELSPSQLSAARQNNLGWVSAYSLNGRESLSNVRGLEFPEETADDVITEIWREAVKAGAPRAMAIVRGSESVRIGFWEQFKVGLRYSLPALISTGYNSAVNTFYLYRAYGIAAAEQAGDYIPWVAAAAATIGVGDAAWDMYTYHGLGGNETSQKLSDYLLTQNVFYRIMVNSGLVEYSEQTIGKDWSPVEFCFPAHELWYHRYPDYNLETKQVPAVCGSGSIMEWKIKEVVEDRITIEKNTNGGPVIDIDLSKTIGNGRYSIYLNDPSAGLLAQTFIIQLINYDETKNEGTFHIYWLSTETPEQQGLCAGANPTRPKDNPCAKPATNAQIFLPFVTRKK